MRRNYDIALYICIQAYYCSICESLLLNIDGLFCDSCGVCADRGCIKLADRTLKCKAITLSSDQSMKHHWVKGVFSFDRDRVVIEIISLAYYSLTISDNV